MSDVFHARCPARRVLDHLTGRWAVLVLSALREQPRRYHQLRTTVDGISDKMLSATLRTLQQDRLVRRTVGAGQPPEVTYAITDLGRGAAAALQPLLDWVRDNADAITGTDGEAVGGAPAGAVGGTDVEVLGGTDVDVSSCTGAEAGRGRACGGADR